jgi:UDP-2,4-diacetamido-2,4,6-trideoxy-beta-L-altropyranose hydrolase
MNAMLRIAVRVDASIGMGMGHLTRCITLANALSAEGARVSFLMRDHAAAFGRLVESAGHQLCLLPATGRGSVPSADPPLAHAHWLPVSWHEDAAQTSEAIGRLGAVDWLVVDHYALDARWEREQRRGAPRILAIDDIADRAHDADILLDQNLSLAMETRYRGLLPENCRPLLGPRYALLRPEFVETRKRMSPRSGEVCRILICFGGSDPSNETAKALAAIAGVSAAALHVDVAIGMGNPHADEVDALCRNLGRATLHRGADNMAELMARADLAIGAGGVMCWERCCLGLPTIALDIASNQVGALTALAAAGALDYLGAAASVNSERLAQAVGALAGNPARLRAMAERALAVTDGEGAERACAEMAHR